VKTLYGMSLLDKFRTIFVEIGAEELHSPPTIIFLYHAIIICLIRCIGGM